MTIADKPHGRTRYNAGCRCGACRTANREHSRQLRSKFLAPVPRPEGSPPAEFIDGPVTEAVRVQLEHLPSAQERPGVFAIAIRLAQLMDNQTAVPQYASAAKALSDIVAMLSKHSTRRTRLSAVRSMTERDSTRPALEVRHDQPVGVVYGVPGVPADPGTCVVADPLTEPPVPPAPPVPEGSASPPLQPLPPVSVEDEPVLEATPPAPPLRSRRAPGAHRLRGSPAQPRATEFAIAFETCCRRAGSASAFATRPRQGCLSTPRGPAAADRCSSTAAGSLSPSLYLALDHGIAPKPPLGEPRHRAVVLVAHCDHVDHPLVITRLLAPLTATATNVS